MTKIEPGMDLYLYSIRTGDFTVHQGVVAETGYVFAVAYKVVFAGNRPSVRCPEAHEIGVVKSTGPLLWLPERDDAKAKQLFIEFEKRKISEHEMQIERRKAMIEKLSGGGLNEEES